jgi:hypothetical protein
VSAPGSLLDHAEALGRLGRALAELLATIASSKHDGAAGGEPAAAENQGVNRDLTTVNAIRD